MTEKRFKLIGDTNIEFLLQDKILLPVYDNGKQLSLKNTIDLLNALHEENQSLKERNNRQKDTITKQQEQIDNYINIKAKLNAKIKEYETKSEEYELSACGCGSKHNWIKKTALKQFKEELFGNE